jgi:hypothetical protein
MKRSWIASSCLDFAVSYRFRYVEPTALFPALADWLLENRELVLDGYLGRSDLDINVFPASHNFVF